MTNDTWIPVGTELPTEDGKYLVTENWHGDKIVSIKRFTSHMSKHVDTRLPDHTDEKGWYDYDHILGMVEAGYVTAWQPLPEAYNVEG